MGLAQGPDGSLYISDSIIKILNFLKNKLTVFLDQSFVSKAGKYKG
jgi:hypothetical protein